MKIKFLIFTLGLLISTLSFGQKNEVYSDLTKSLDYVKASFSDIEDYESYLKNVKVRHLKMQNITLEKPKIVLMMQKVRRVQQNQRQERLKTKLMI